MSLDRHPTPFLPKLAPALVEFGMYLKIGTVIPYVRLLYDNVPPERVRAWRDSLANEGCRWWVVFGPRQNVITSDATKRMVSLNAVRWHPDLAQQDAMLAATIVCVSEPVDALEMGAVTKDQVLVEISDGRMIWELWFRPSLYRAFAGEERPLVRAKEGHFPTTTRIERTIS